MSILPLLSSPLLSSPLLSSPLLSSPLLSSPLLSSPLLSSPHPPGSGVNLGMRGLESMASFIYQTATAVDQNDILEALSVKMQHSRQVAETFRQTGLAESMYEWSRGTSWWMQNTN